MSPVRFSLLSVARQGLAGNEGWPEQWRSPEPKPAYDAVIVGAGGHGLGTAYYMAREHGLRNIAVLDPPVKLRQFGSQHLVGGLGFKVDTQQLLLTADHPQFDDRVKTGILVERGVDALGSDESLQGLPRLIAPYNREKTRLRAQRRHVTGNVCGTARPVVGAGYPNDRHRRLG